MSDPISTTRISDLPENITVQMQPTQYSLPQGPPAPQSMGNNAQQVDIGQNTYVPINIHPNPFGVQQTDPTVPLPQSLQQRGPNQIGNGGLDPAMEIQHRLPSRDIPMNSLAYQQDDEIQPNFIPKAKLTSDYIREYEEASDLRLKQHEEKKHRESAADSIFSKLQIPILISILFFLFQSPILNRLFLKYVSFLPIFNEDGNMNFAGIVIKSILFGIVFYSLQMTADYF